MDLIKYPRTPHLPWSPGATSDDRMLTSVDHFVGKQVVATVKMDGENTTMYRDHIHARSRDSGPHPSRSWVTKLWAERRYDIPVGWRICGENLQAVHSIRYDHLPSYFLVFSIWDGDLCLNYTATQEWAELLGLHMVPELYRGVWDMDVIRRLYTPSYAKDEMEGYVIRLHDEFKLDQFGQSMAKYVRRNHVQTDEHWMSRPIEPNGLAS